MAMRMVKTVVNEVCAAVTAPRLSADARCVLPDLLGDDFVAGKSGLEVKTKGPNGTVMKQCTQATADATHCTDYCGGMYGDLGDGFLYRYYVMGDESDGVSNALAPLPGPEYFPYTPRCLLGAVCTI